MRGMNGHIEVLADAELLAQHVAEWMTAFACASPGPLRVALAGGETPKGLYRALAEGPSRARFPWPRVRWYFGDERFVPHADPASNYRMAQEALLSKANVAAENVFAIPVDGTPDAAARSYQRTLQRAYGDTVLHPERPLFDLTLLGLGSDGHTASLLPGEPVLEERARWVAAVSHGRPELRITLTYPALESSRRVAFLVAGESKAPIVRALRGGELDVPAARLRPVGEQFWFLDRAAFGGPP